MANFTTLIFDNRKALDAFLYQHRWYFSVCGHVTGEQPDGKWRLTF